MSELLAAEFLKQTIGPLVRQAVRDEIAALLPHVKEGPALLSIRECATKYRRGYNTIARMAKKGELLALPRMHGEVEHLMIVAADAARKFGGE